MSENLASPRAEKPPTYSPFKINFVGIVEADLVMNERNREGTLLLFAIRVATGLHAWEVQRSPRDFEILYASLKERYRDLALPSLPKVRRMWRSIVEYPELCLFPLVFSRLKEIKTIFPM